MEWDMGNEIRFDLLVLYPLILHIFIYPFVCCHIKR